MNRKDAFLNYQAQITKTPFLLDIKKAEGSYIYTQENKKYLDLVAGVSSCTLGHSHPSVIKATKKQLDNMKGVLEQHGYVVLTKDAAQKIMQRIRNS